MLPLWLIPLLLGSLILGSGARAAWASLPSTCDWDAGHTWHVPGDFDHVQDAVQEAEDCDTIVIAPGVYTTGPIPLGDDREALVEITGKDLTLQSNFATSGDPADVLNTVLEAPFRQRLNDNDTPDEPADDFVELVPGDVVEVQRRSRGGLLQKTSHVVLRGLTVSRGESGVVVRSDCLVELLDGRVVENKDGFSLEGRDDADTHGLARGVVKRSVLERNRDDGADSDSRSELWIEDSTLQDNGQDGLEIRLHDNHFGEGERIQDVILRNRFLRNGQDGLQLIDYPEPTPRSFRIERNLFGDNGAAGVGNRCAPETNENFEGCATLERIDLVHNTFVGNDHGLTGGANLVGVNNLFAGHAKGVKNVVSPSLLSHTLFFANTVDEENSSLESIRGGDPRLTDDEELSDGSAAVDAGTRFFAMNGETILSLGPCDYRGREPDLGAFELDTGAAVLDVLDMGLASGQDDANEKRGKVKIAGKRLELGSSKGGSVVALRFPGIAIDPGALVLSARLQLTAAKKAKKSADLVIHGEASADAAPLSEAANDLSGRTRTAASVAWSPPVWPEKGASGPDQQTPDLANVVQEIVHQEGWASGNAFTFFVSGRGKRSVAAREGGGKALLHIELGFGDTVCAPP